MSAKTMMPAPVCKSDWTSASTCSPMYYWAFWITTIVPSGM